MVWSAAHWLTSRWSRWLQVSITQPEPPPSALPMPANSARQRASLPKSRSIADASAAPGRLGCAEAGEVDLVQDHRVPGDQLLALEAVERKAGRRGRGRARRARRDRAEALHRAGIVVVVVAGEQLFRQTGDGLGIERHGRGLGAKAAPVGSAAGWRRLQSPGPRPGRRRRQAPGGGRVSVRSWSSSPLLRVRGLAALESGAAKPPRDAAGDLGRRFVGNRQHGADVDLAEDVGCPRRTAVLGPERKSASQIAGRSAGSICSRRIMAGTQSSSIFDLSDWNGG